MNIRLKVPFLLQCFLNFDVPCNYLGSLKNTNARLSPKTLCLDMYEIKQATGSFKSFQVILMSNKVQELLVYNFFSLVFPN